LPGIFKRRFFVNNQDQADFLYSQGELYINSQVKVVYE